MINEATSAAPDNLQTDKETPRSDKNTVETFSVDVVSPQANFTARGIDVMVRYDITVPHGQTVGRVLIALKNENDSAVIRQDEAEPQARQANFQLHYLEKQSEHHKRYPPNYDSCPELDGIIAVPNARFEVAVTLSNGKTTTGRSGVFHIDRCSE